RKIPIGDHKPFNSALVPDGRKAVFWEQGPQGEAVPFVADLESGSVRPGATPNLRGGGLAVSLDGELMAYDATDGSVMAVSLSGDALRRLPGPPIDRDDQLVTWSEDGKYLFLIQRRGEMPGVFLRREVATGKTTRWIEFQPADLTGVTGL